MVQSEASVQSEVAAAPAEAVPLLPSRRMLAFEVCVVVLLAVGLSALRSVLSFLVSLMRALESPGGSLRSQSATLNASQAPSHPWIDLGYQLVFSLSLVLPALLAIYLVARDRVGSAGSVGTAASVGAAGSAGTAGTARARTPKRWLPEIGIVRRGWPTEVLLGLGLAAGVGGVGLAAYLISYASGTSVTVVPTTLPDVWWRLPVLILSALANAALEETVLVGYLVTRLERVGLRLPVILAISAGLRGLYHLYQGLAGCLGNVAMGVLFVAWFARRRSIVALFVAHATIDTVVFVGWTLLHGHVSWIPG
ncbi:MAG: CPBP family intramembrane glutamic endopeptidase [Actinomycetales bacterium]